MASGKRSLAEWTPLNGTRIQWSIAIDCAPTSPPEHRIYASESLGQNYEE